MPVEERSITWTAPMFSFLISSYVKYAPAAKSGVPSRFRSPTAAREEPKWSDSPICGPLVELISAVLFTVPSEFMNITCTAPSLRMSLVS